MGRVEKRTCRDQKENGVATRHEPFMICSVCNNDGLECRHCDSQGYIPEDWHDLNEWVPWGEA